ncbi:MAG: hypothetical protein Q7R51_01540 [bacterium]|nr:hypothetical protein [bacterium]
MIKDVLTTRAARPVEQAVARRTYEWINGGPWGDKIQKQTKKVIEPTVLFPKETPKGSHNFQDI